jgi:hypothetical protein
MRLNLKYIVVTVVAEDDDSLDDDLAVEEEGIATHQGIGRGPVWLDRFDQQLALRNQ